MIPTWFKSWNWGLKNVQNWAHTLNAGLYQIKKINWNWNYRFHQIPIVNEKKEAFHVVVHFTWWSNCKAMKMTNSLKCCCFGWQIPKPQWEWIKAWMVVNFAWSNAEKRIWKKLWTMLFWMIKSKSIIEWKKACMFVIWGHKFLKKSKMEWKKALNFCCSFWHDTNAKQWRWNKESSTFLFRIMKMEKSLECCCFGWYPKA